MCQNHVHMELKKLSFHNSKKSNVKIKTASLTYSPCMDCLFMNNDIKSSELIHLIKEA